MSGIPGSEGPMSRILIEELRAFRAAVDGRFDTLRADLMTQISRMVTQEAFQAEQRRMSEKFDVVNDTITAERVERERSVATERHAREKAFAAERERSAAIEAVQAKTYALMRWVAAGIALPVALFLAQILWLT